MMFKLGVFSDEISQDLREAAALARKYGAAGLELRSVWDTGVFDLSEAQAVEIQTILDGEGMAVCAIASPFWKCDMADTEARAAHLESLKRCCDMAALWNTRIIRGFTFWRTKPRDVRAIAEALRAPAELLHAQGLTLALESDPSVNACNARELAEIIALADTPGLSAVWDPGNDLFAPVAETPYPQGYELIRPYMAHMHIKDAREGDDGPEAVCIGQGDVHMEEQLSAMVRDGYEGWAVLETHYRSHKLNEHALRLPGGQGFSQGGYEASEQCLAALQGIMARIAP